MSDVLLQIKGLSFAYSKEKILENISLTLKRGQMLCLLGANGCGKTTLLSCVLGFLKPESGRVLLSGKDIKDLSAAESAAIVSYIAQTHKQVFPYTVEEIVLMGRAAYTPFYSSPSKADRDIAYAAMEMVGIAHFARKPYTQLSGGEMQLVMLARAIAQGSDLIVMDEPTAHLDGYNELLVLERIKMLVKTQNAAVLMATHFPNQVLNFVNSGLTVGAALIKNHRILDMGNAETVLTEKNISELYNIRVCIIEKEYDGIKIKQIVPVGLQDEKL